MARVRYSDPVMLGTAEPKFTGSEYRTRATRFKFDLAVVFVAPDDTIQGSHSPAIPTGASRTGGVASVNSGIARLLAQTREGQLA